ncbi:MAG TPA: ferrochelatase [Myxococcota bacterium]|nr:ferrochelatase [Myxococcota bacterium]
MTSVTGVLLAQLGTPASPTTGDVRRYLREFLSDPRVIDLPAPARWLLVNLVIAPFRAPRSARAYQAIWTPEGSPLLVHSRAFAEALQRELGGGFRVALGMRYGAPSLAAAFAELCDAGVSRIVALPLYPQLAESSTGTAIAAIRAAAAQRAGAPPLSFVPAFFGDAGFIGAVAEAARPVLASGFDHVLFSYHGLPERHVRAADATREHCLASARCCDAPPAAVLASCYRAQCFATTRAVASALALPPERVTTAFQSRLGRDPWIQPWSDEELPRLAARGVKRLAVLCPSFVADCLETLEEVGIRARDQWRALGGDELALAPCVNASPAWVRAAAELVRRGVSAPLNPASRTQRPSA